MILKLKGFRKAFRKYGKEFCSQAHNSFTLTFTRFHFHPPVNNFLHMVLVNMQLLKVYFLIRICYCISGDTYAVQHKKVSYKVCEDLLFSSREKKNINL